MLLLPDGPSHLGTGQYVELLHHFLLLGFAVVKVLLKCNEASIRFEHFSLDYLVLDLVVQLQFDDFVSISKVLYVEDLIGVASDLEPGHHLWQFDLHCIGLSIERRCE